MLGTARQAPPPSGYPATIEFPIDGGAIELLLLLLLLSLPLPLLPALA